MKPRKITAEQLAAIVANEEVFIADNLHLEAGNLDNVSFEGVINLERFAEILNEHFAEEK